MIAQKLLAAVVFATFTLPLCAQVDGAIEPNAGNWRTWVISSGRDYRVPPPPGAAQTQAELRSLALLMSHNNAQSKQQIEFWNAGSPAYRWMDLLNSRALAGTAIGHSPYTYVAQAMYDATIAAWESKYYYKRQRPSKRDPELPTLLPVP